MAKEDRKGNRKNREQNRKIRVPELGYYLIVTDTKGTEQCYFNGLYDKLPEEIKCKIVIKVVETKTYTLIEKCMELTARDAQYRIPWIIFDRDQVSDFDDIIVEAESNGIKVGWSNPCFEIWMSAYFGLMPTKQDSSGCCKEFGRTYEKMTGRKYKKTDKQLYELISKSGDEQKAIQIAEQKSVENKRDGKAKPSERCPGTTVHELVKELKGKRQIQ